MMNKVIIFGGDHYNALGLVRVFGINGIKPYGVLVVPDGQERNKYAAKSKYWDKIWFVKNEEEGLDTIIANFSCEKEKAVIIPSSDTAEETIDNNLDSLKNDFFVPSINDQQGRVCELMNKTKQAKWAKEIGLKTAESWELELDNNNCVDSIMSYPCILKPVLSSEGKKFRHR